MIDTKNQVIRNCHVKGLHSVVMSEHRGRLTRMFMADTDHELYQSTDADRPLLAYHAHHRDITIRPLYGDITNIIVEFASNGPIQVAQWLYESAIRDGRGGFRATDQWVRLAIKQLDYLRSDFGDSVDMRADVMHTVEVKRGECAAWIVEEGEADPDYRPYAYSAADLSQIDWSQLYLKA